MADRAGRNTRRETHRARIISREPLRGGGYQYIIGCGEREYVLVIADQLGDDGKPTGRCIPIISPVRAPGDHQRARAAGMIAIERLVNNAPEPMTARLRREPPPTPPPPPMLPPDPGRSPGHYFNLTDPRT